MRTQSVTPLRQLFALSRAEFILLRRNAVQLFYAIAMPLMVPILLMNITQGPGKQAIVASAVSFAILLTIVLVSYYNPLSALVNRREESTLQRLRAGELTDSLILLSVCTPGIILGLIVPVLTLLLAKVIINLQTPSHPVLIALAIVLAIALMCILAMVTANFTRTPESAQLTSMPIIILLSIGSLAPMLQKSVPLALRAAIEATPGAPFAHLMSMGWFGSIDAAVIARSVAILAAWLIGGLIYTAGKFRWAPRV